MRQKNIMHTAIKWHSYDTKPVLIILQDAGDENVLYLYDKTRDWSSLSLSPLPGSLEHLFNATQKSKQVYFLIIFLCLCTGYLVMFYTSYVIVVIIMIIIIITRNTGTVHTSTKARLTWLSVVGR